MAFNYGHGYPILTAFYGQQQHGLPAA